MKKHVFFFQKKFWLLGITILAFCFMETYSQSDGFLFEDLESDILKETDESDNMDSANLMQDVDYAVIDEINEEIAYEGIIMEQEEPEPEQVQSLPPDSTENIKTEISTTEIRQPTQKFPFYRKWWFTLLLLIPLGYFAYLYYGKREESMNELLNSEKKSSEKLRVSLQEKEEYYQKKEKEFHAKLVEEEELKFQAQGLNKFAEVISGNKDDLAKLGQKLIYELVEYVGANAGVIYIVSDDSDEKRLDLLSAYAPDKKQMKSSFSPGEGYIGTCFNEGNILEISDVPETYSKIASGLGKALPKHLIFLPLLQDEEKLGVIEIASFEKLPKYKADFIEKISQNLASSIVIQRATDKMQQMLEQSRVQAEELRAQEEEMRQNLEEMQATQEQLNRQAEENKKMQQALIEENAFMEALMKNLPDYIYFKDLESKFLKNSLSHAKLFGIKDPEELIGKSDFDFFSEEHAKPAYDAEQKIIKTGKPIIDLVEKEVKKDGSIAWVSTTKLPLKDSEGNIIGTFGISRDISKTMNLEMDTREKNEQLLSQEEELRQNLEEMQTVQEELQRQKEVLEKEQALMETLLKNAVESIYFKDTESRFIRVSESMAAHFNAKSSKELVGKSDFDFFTEEHARPAFEDEKYIMKKKKPIIDKIEKETHADGRVTWVSTSKMPLLDKKGKVIGTFGISKDVTQMVEMEMELKQQNEELQAQEEELRQNLEEMQTVQEELQRQKETLVQEQALMETLLKNARESIYFKDEQSRFIKASDSMAKLFKVKTVDEIYGKTDFDFFTEEHANPAFYDEMNIIKTKKPIIDKIEKETHPDGRVSWVSTSKMPLLDKTGKVIGTFGISKDITHIKTMQEELRIDKALLDALMNNLPDYIYFKDQESRFIRISKSMLKLFPFDKLEDMVGKSDFDFQPKETAQRYFEEEKKIIKTGKGFIDHIEHEVMENGVEQWVSTTKMPLFDEMGKCIGTFGITKDITNLKELEKLAGKTKK
jgi:PAS domain S-box-containing protein